MSCTNAPYNTWIIINVSPWLSAWYRLFLFALRKALFIQVLLIHVCKQNVMCEFISLSLRLTCRLARRGIYECGFGARRGAVHLR